MKENDGITEDLLSAIKREAANSSLKGIRESIERTKDKINRREVFRYAISKDRALESIIPIYNDYIWTLNLAYIERLCDGFIYAVRKAENWSERPFGGWIPSSKESGLWPVRDKQFIGIAQDERSVFLLVGFFIMPGEDRRLVSLHPDLQVFWRTGPLTPTKTENSQRVVLMPEPILMEPRSVLNIKEILFWDEKEGEVDGDTSHVRAMGYWIRW